MKKDYKKLLDRAAKEYESFSLIWRDQSEFDNSAKQIEEALSPYLIETKKTNEWPGTKLIGDETATIRLYRVTMESLDILKVVDNIFDWLSPTYPEDLTFYKNSKPAYISIAHEKEAWYEKT